jgi:hypothetical protein
MEHINTSTESFIGSYQIPENICNEIIKYFKKNKLKQKKGVIGYNEVPIIDIKIKESIDIQIPVKNNINIFNKYNEYLFNYVKQYCVTYPELNKCSLFGLTEGYNIQYYKKNAGFKQWHFERTSNLNRMLVFMTYLNDVEDGGTFFKYQNIKTKAKKGTTLIWPTDFTHTHKGEISTKSHKYILTGWLGFIPK